VATKTVSLGGKATPGHGAESDDREADMKRIVVFDIVSHLGGAQRSTAEFLARMGKTHEALYVDGCGSIPEHLTLLADLGVRHALLSPGSRIQRLPSRRRWLARARTFPEFVRVCSRLRAFLRKWAPDLVIVISPKTAVVAALAGAGMPGGLLYWCRGSHIPPAVARLPVAARIGLFAVLSQRAREESVALGVPPERIEIIPTAVDLAAIRREANRVAGPRMPAPGGPVILLPATLLPTKGQEWAIRALPEVRRSTNAELWLAGDEGGSPTGYRSRLQQVAGELGVVDGLRFLGPRDDLLPIMRSCDVVLLPSHSEGVPRVVVEACVLGVPVVGSAVGAIPELLEDGAGGWLVDVGDVGGLARALLQALTDGTMRLEKADRARAHVEMLCAPERQVVAFARAMARLEELAG
jgi:glycosyltransferase involved in cell wall biosynthesis